jgi:serine phosphatase RsbU (regulator of sigma subunit)
LYSEQRLLDVLAANHQCDVKHLTENVVTSISDYVSTAEQSDDLTILIVNYKKQSN